MLKSFRIAATGAALAAVSFATTAQAADSATATATAEVLATISVTKTLDMSFGQIAVNGDGTFVLNADGTYTCSGTLICTGTRRAAEFLVEGTAAVGVTASVDQTSIDLVHTVDNTKEFVLDDFTVDFPAGNSLVGGEATFNVGGTLNVVSAMALAGVYSGTFDVTVEYE